MTNRDELHLLTGAYALGALNEEESADFEAYLAESESLRSEVAELTDTAVVLGLATAPVAPPADLKARIMGLVATTPQFPASTTGSAEQSEQRQDRPEDLTTVRDLAPAPAATASSFVAPAASASDRARTRWFTRPLVALSAAAAAVALFVAGGLMGQTLFSGSDDLQLAQAEGLAELNAAPDLQRASADVANGSTATLIWSGELDRSAVVFDELDTLPSDLVYQAWYIDDAGTATPAGTFESDGEDTTFRVLDGALSSGNTVGVTVEPAGGSEEPTTEPIVAIKAA